MRILIMKPGRIWSGIGITLAVLGVVAAQRYLRADERKPNGSKTTMGRAVRTPVLVELFTSEGCSSCPSADRLLANLATSQPIEGAEVIALEEHVDYWDRIGWKDPFSNAAFTKRQYDYGSLFHLNSVYTPQAVVDGQKEFVGSEKGTAVSAIMEAATRPKANVELHVTTEDASQIHVNVAVDNLPTRSDAAQVLLAVTEDDLKVHVNNGENSGRNLVHHGVVRRLLTLGAIKDKTPFSTQVTVPLERPWKRENLRIVAFVQSDTSLRILGVGSAGLKALPKG
jgi:hypothetical protein